VRIVCPDSGTQYFRVAETEGWVFDKRKDHQMMVVISDDDVVNAQPGAWNVDFVRGMAATIDGMEEILFNPTSRVISFQDDAGVRSNVYYATQTIGTVMDHPSQGKTQLFRRNCSVSELAEILKNPRTYIGRGYKRRKTQKEHGYELTDSSGKNEADTEEDLRSYLIECDASIAQLQRHRKSLLHTILSHDEKRTRYENKMHQKQSARLLEKKKKEELQLEKLLKSIQQNQKKHGITCSVCSRAFVSSRALEQHFDAVHGHTCTHCGRRFGTSNSLHQHKSALNH